MYSQEVPGCAGSLAYENTDFVGFGVGAALALTADPSIVPIAKTATAEIRPIRIRSLSIARRNAVCRRTHAKSPLDLT